MKRCPQQCLPFCSINMRLVVALFMSATVGKIVTSTSVSPVCSVSTTSSCIVLKSAVSPIASTVSGLKQKGGDAY